MKTLLSACMALVMVFTLVASVHAATYRQAQYLMGTVFEITVDTHTPLSLTQQAALFEPLFARLRAQDLVLSHYREDSELSQVIAALHQDPPVPQTLSPDLCYALRQGQHYFELTGGAFDITIGPLVALWGFKHDNFRVPRAEERLQTLKMTGFRQLRFQSETCVLQQVAPVDNPLDFSAIGKGIAIDRAVQHFEQVLAPQYPMVAGLAVQGGGSSAYFWGAPVATPQGWPVFPRQGGEVFWLKDQALGVSGLDQRFFVHQGQRYGHILDPRSGQALPQADEVQRSSYVVAPSAEQADVFSTTLWLVSPAQAQQWAEALNFRFWWEPGSPAHYPVGEFSSDDPPHNAGL